jgi:hypothetical protein
MRASRAAGAWPGRSSARPTHRAETGRSVVAVLLSLKRLSLGRGSIAQDWRWLRHTGAG